MLSSSILTSCLVLLATVHAFPAADRTTGRMAPRAVTSEGTTCYFTCPTVIQPGNGAPSAPLVPNFLPPLESGGQGCLYSASENLYFCTYTADGNLDGTADNDGGCPLVADSAGCFPSTDPTPDGAFRRSTTRAPAQPLTRAEKIVKARQYNPKKAKRVQA